MTFGRNEGLLPEMNDSERPIVNELYGPRDCVMGARPQITGNENGFVRQVTGFGAEWAYKERDACGLTV